MYGRKALLGVSTLLIGVATGMAWAAEVREAPMTWQNVARSDGESLYRELCSVCHGDDGTGNGPAASALKQAAPDLTALSARNGGTFPRERVVDTITGSNRVVVHGTQDMPVWGRVFSEVRPDRRPSHRAALGQQRIYNLATFLESIQSE